MKDMAKAAMKFWQLKTASDAKLDKQFAESDAKTDQWKRIDAALSAMQTRDVQAADREHEARLAADPKAKRPVPWRDPFDWAIDRLPDSVDRWANRATAGKVRRYEEEAKARADRVILEHGGTPTPHKPAPRDGWGSTRRTTG